jgi:aminoglycoside phosphotransferase (APT) family kinase protein
MVTEAGGRIGVGRMAEVFAFGEGRVIKLLRDPAHRAMPDHELAAQHAVAAAGVDAPAAYEIVELDGRPGLVMQRVAGTDGLTACEKQPWRVWSVSSRTGRLQREMSRVPAPEGVRSLKDIARWDIEHSQRVPERARGRLLALLEDLPDGDCLCHMDFHLGNVMLDDDRLTVIDFASSRRGDPIADHVKSLILFDASTPVEMGRKERVVVLLGRKVARAAYVRGYGRLSAEEADRARRWWPVLIGQRLSEGIPEERKPLLRLLSRKLREAGG